jgi:hypothetical protein
MGATPRSPEFVIASGGVVREHGAPPPIRPLTSSNRESNCQRDGFFMSGSAVVPEVVHDGSVERVVDPEEVSLAAATTLAALPLPHAPLNPCRVGTQVAMQRAVQSSLASGKTEQISRDAAMARALTTCEKAFM